MPTQATKSHKNSHRVKIFRRETFLEGIQTTAAEFMSMSKKSIGSYFQSKMSRTIGTGLTPGEEVILMPRVLSMSANDNDFRKEVAHFFSSMSTPIPYGIGKEFEIGLEEDNDAPVSQTNFPLDLGDFIRYRHALNHPAMATSRAMAEGDMTKEFYIYDPEEAQGEINRLNKDKDTALSLYLELKNDPEKVSMMLTLLGVDPRRFAGKAADDQRAEALRKLADSSPQTFQSVYKEDHLKERYLIRTLLNTQILKKVGSQFVDGETAQTLGHEILDVIAFLKDPANADQVQMYKARMQEAMKLKVEADRPIPELVTSHKPKSKAPR